MVSVSHLKEPFGSLHCIILRVMRCYDCISSYVCITTIVSLSVDFLMYIISHNIILYNLFSYSTNHKLNKTGKGSALLLHSLKFRHTEQQGLFSILVKLLILKILTSCSN